jgi:hypothetical protein
MKPLSEQRIIVTGGNSGLGLGLVEALVERRAQVTVLARNPAHLAEVHERLGVDTIAGDIADQDLPATVLARVRPDVIVLNAGSVPMLAPIHEQTWENFSVVWNTDVRAGLQWIQAALRLPLAPGSRVLIGSSGAAVNGSPLSGGYAGAKRMLWLMADYANDAARRLGLGIRFQVLVPRQMVGETARGHEAAEAYAKRLDLSVPDFLARFGKPMPPRQFGEHVVSILTDPRYAEGTAFGLKGDTGITSLDAQAA